MRSQRSSSGVVLYVYAGVNILVENFRSGGAHLTDEILANKQARTSKRKREKSQNNIQKPPANAPRKSESTTCTGLIQTGAGWCFRFSRSEFCEFYAPTASSAAPSTLPTRCARPSREKYRTKILPLQAGRAEPVGRWVRGD